MGRRHHVAQEVQKRWNIADISDSLVTCINECRLEGIDPTSDPAIRLIVHQLLSLSSRN